MHAAAQPERPRRLAELPGPRGLPLLGNLLQVQPHRFHRQLEEWHAVYGDTFRVSMGGRRFLVVADPGAISAALRDRPAVINRSERLVANAAEMGFDGIFAANGEAWQRQRPMVMGAFAPGHIKSYFPTLARVTRRLERRWQRALTEAHDIDLTADLMRYTVDAISGLAFGADIDTLERDDDVIQQHLDKIFPALTRRLAALFPYWHWVKLPADRELDRHLAALHAAVQEFIAQARARLAADATLRESPANLIEAMLVARDSPASGLDDKDVAGNVLTLLLAGEDTTAHTLAWMIYLLSRHPAALQRASAEAHAALGDERVPASLAQTESLAYIEACCHETMRLKPVAPLQVGQAGRDTVVAGVEVPRGCLLLFLMRPGSLDARHFESPQSFDPERWLRADGVHGAMSAAKRISMPFGAGPRICPGRYLALLEMKMVMAMLLCSFEIEAVTTPDGGEAVERLAMTMSPVGLKLRLKARVDTASRSKA